MTTATPANARTSLLGVVITQAIAFVGCLVVPVIVTLIAPLSTLDFVKSGRGTTVTVTRYVLIVVPWRTQRIDDVVRLRVDLTAEFRHANTQENRRKDRTGTSHATGQIAIIGNGPEVIVQAATDLAQEVALRFERFSAASTPAPTSIPVYASWSLSYLLGGAVTALCALYVAGVVLSVIALPFRVRAKSRNG